MIPTLEQVKIQLTLKGIAYMDNWLLYRDRIKSTNQNIAISSIEDAYNKLVDGYYEMNKNPLERDGIIYRAYDNFILAFTKEGVVCNVQDQRAKLFVESRLNSPFGFETTKLSLRNVRLAFDDASMSLYLNTHNPIFTVAKDEQFISWFSWLLSTPYKALFTQKGYVKGYFIAQVMPAFQSRYLINSRIAYELPTVEANPYDLRLLIGLIAFNEYKYFSQTKDRFTFEGHNLV